MVARSRGPYVIAAIGGSGTRVLAAILRQSGMWIGAHLNGPLDALDFADYCARWIPIFPGNTSRPLSTAALHEMRQGLSSVVERHLSSMGDANIAWGWKNSGSLHLLRFLHDEFPDMKLLHLVRDGRDMAYSPNQYQVRRYGSFLLTPEERRWSQPLRSIAVWSRLNVMAADYAETRLQGQYLRIRFEDLCAAPIPAVRSVLEFCGLRGDAVRIAHDQVASPSSLGRWRHQSPQTVAKMNEIARAALQRFGYRDEGTTDLRRTPRERMVAVEEALRSRLSAGLGGHVAERYRRLREIRARMWRHGR
jgi:hypothetical protein